VAVVEGGSSGSEEVCTIVGKDTESKQSFKYENVIQEA
jgi:hypothetical protein